MKQIEFKKLFPGGHGKIGMFSKLAVVDGKYNPGKYQEVKKAYGELDAEEKVKFYIANK